MQAGANNVRLVKEFDAYLRVEKGLRPNSCESYVRDVEQFAEHVEKRDGVLRDRDAGGCAGIFAGAGGEWERCADAGSATEWAARILQVAAAG